MIGPGKAFDTEKYFVVCSNVIGGCMGSTGPASIDPGTRKLYGLKFPMITIADMVDVQKKLIDHLGIRQLFAVAGGSMGGMQVLQWAVSYPDMVRFAISIATSAYSSPQQIAFGEVGRSAIISDPDWNHGDYHSKTRPVRGLALARMVGHITYLSDASMHQKFGRRLQDRDGYSFDLSTDFQVESYLHYKGNSFTKRFDANSYLYITKAIDYFDLTSDGSLIDAFRGVQAKFLVIAVTSDWLYPPYQSKEIAMALSANDVEAGYCEINSHYGHDAFLLETGQLSYIITNFLSHPEVKDVMTDVTTIRDDASIEEASRTMLASQVTHLPVVSEEMHLTGIVTAWDIARAIAEKHQRLEDIMTRNVIISDLDEPIEQAVEKLEAHNISALPVLDHERKVIGMVTSEGISRLVGWCRWR